MKKLITLAIIGVFILSLVPFAFAQKDSNKAEARAEVKAKSETRKQANIERLKILKEENRVKIEALDAEKIDKVSNLSQERLQKIAELDKSQIERLSKLEINNLNKISELKRERLERLSRLNEKKLERLAELDKEKLEKISDLTEEELQKLSSQNRARFKKSQELDISKLKAELKSVKISKVKNSEELNKRKISDSDIIRLKVRFDKAKSDFKEAKKELEIARKQLSQSKEKTDEKAILQSAKNYLLKTADAIMLHLEKLKVKVQESKNIEESSETAIVAELDAQIAEIRVIKQEAEAATTKEQIKESAKKLHIKWRKLKHLISLYSERVISARVEGIVNRGIVLEKKLDKILEMAKEKGIEIDISRDIGLFSEKIAISKEKQKQAQNKLREALDLKAKGESEDSDKIKALVDESKQLLKEANGAVKEAHDILKGIIKRIREADTTANLSSDIEVEVVHEAEGLGEEAAVKT